MGVPRAALGKERTVGFLLCEMDPMTSHCSSRHPQAVIPEGFLRKPGANVEQETQSPVWGLVRDPCWMSATPALLSGEPAPAPGPWEPILPHRAHAHISVMRVVQDAPSRHSPHQAGTARRPRQEAWPGREGSGTPLCPRGTSRGAGDDSRCFPGLRNTCPVALSAIITLTCLVVF